MLAYGYTDKYRWVPVDLSREEVAENMIDLWLVNPLAADYVPEPTAKPLEFRSNLGESVVRVPALRFQRLHDFSFAYAGDNGTITVGILRDGEPMCVIGRHRQEADGLELTVVEVSRRPFREHYLEYLTQFEVAYKDRFSTKVPRPGCPAPPRRSKAVKLRGGALIVSGVEMDPRSIAFSADMFAACSFNLSLPDRINWLLQALQPWQPIVFGAAIRAALRREGVEKVDVCVNKGAVDEVERFLIKQGARPLPDPADYQGWSFPWKSKDKMVELGGLTVQIAERECHMLDQWLMHAGSQFYSADRVYSSRPNACCGARIALADIGLNQTRPFITMGSKNPRAPEYHKDRFRKEKMEILPSPGEDMKDAEIGDWLSSAQQNSNDRCPAFQAAA